MQWHNHRSIWKGNPTLPIMFSVMAPLDMENQLGVFGSLPTTETDANKMRLWSLRTCVHSLVLCGFSHMYLQARTTVDAGDICTWRITVILIMEKPKHPNWRSMLEKSGVDVWYLTSITVSTTWLFQMGGGMKGGLSLDFEVARHFWKSPRPKYPSNMDVSRQNDVHDGILFKALVPTH